MPLEQKSWMSAPCAVFTRRCFVMGAAGLLLALGTMTASAQSSFRLGNWDMTMVGKVDIAYDSNVDDSYPEEIKEDYQSGDFLWTPGVSLVAKPMALRHSLTLGLSGEISYEDYFERNDLDTALYSLQLDFQTLARRVAFGGYALAKYDVEAEEDEYRPGGAKRDPYATQEGNLFLNWNYGRLRVESSVIYTRERYENIESRTEDKDETDAKVGVYLDVFTWGSIYYSYEYDNIIYALDDSEELEVTKEFGLDGSIPLSWLTHPKVTYSIGFKSEDDDGKDDEKASWEPNHTIRLEDEFQLSKALRFSGYAEWENKVYDDEIGFTYNLKLEHIITPRIQHSVTFEQEPESTFGSNTDTKKTTYTYDIGVRDIFIRNFNMGFNAEYKEETPLDSDDLTEDTTILTYTASHARQFSRRLGRLLSYEYSWENSNFHHEGAKEKHLVTYGWNYLF